MYFIGSYKYLYILALFLSVYCLASSVHCCISGGTVIDVTI